MVCVLEWMEWVVVRVEWVAGVLGVYDAVCNTVYDTVWSRYGRELGGFDLCTQRV